MKTMMRITMKAMMKVMMTKTVLIRILLIVFCMMGPVVSDKACAQDLRSTASYLIGFPTDDTGDFVEDPSFAGFDLDFGLKVLSPNNEVSFVLGWQRFKEDQSGSTYTDSSSGLTITADQERSLTTLPLLLKYRHYFSVNEAAKWFAGAGAGAAYVERRFFVGSFDFSHYGWQFILRPEGGLSYAISSNTSIEASLRYDYGFDTGSLPTLGVFTLGFGVSANF